MYLPGTIFYFTPFYFNDGKTASKNKYFIVLCNGKEQMIVASLPSSQDYVPAFAQKNMVVLIFLMGALIAITFLPVKL